MRAAPGVGGIPEPFQGTSATAVKPSWLLGTSADNEVALLLRKDTFQLPSFFTSQKIARDNFVGEAICFVTSSVFSDSHPEVAGKVPAWLAFLFLRAMKSESAA